MGKKASPANSPIDLKRLRLRDGDMVVIRDMSDSHEYRQAVVERIQASTKAKVSVIFVQRLSDIKLLTEKQLKSIGLVRINDA
jgi:hypothetical protein